MPSRFFISSISIPLFIGIGLSLPSFAQSIDTNRAVQLIKQRCIKCHSGDVVNGGVDFGDLNDELDVWKSRHTYSKALDMLTRGKMPPETEPTFEGPKRELLTSWLSHTLENVDVDRIPNDPGFLPPRRLNRTQYNYTVQDLFGIDISSGDVLPPEQIIGDAFDNEISSLTVEPLWFEKALAAANETVRAVWSDTAALNRLLATRPTPPPVEEVALFVASPEVSEDLPTGVEDFTIVARFMGSPGHIFTRAPAGARFTRGSKQLSFGKNSITYRLDSRRVIEIKNLEWDLDSEHVVGLSQEDQRISLYLDGRLLASVADFEKPDYPNHLLKIGQPARVPREDEEDEERRTIKFPRIAALDFYREALPESTMLMITSKSYQKKGLQPSFGWTENTKSIEPEVITTKQAGVKVLGNFLAKAFRRPPTENETTRYVELFLESTKAGMPFDLAMQLPVTAALSSPSFLLRNEETRDTDESYAIASIDMASRLSYFLWSSSPDEELLKAGLDGDLLTPEMVLQQTNRMLSHPKAYRFFERFVVQWLRTDGLGDTYKPDTDRFPDVDDALMAAMRQEGVKIVEDVFLHDRPLLELLDNNSTFVNSTLAKHYDIDSTGHSEWRKVNLGDSSRGGLLTTAAVLTVSSSPRRTSPVFRGKWVLDVLLGEPPPPPPPNVPELPAATESKGSSLRDLLEAHRSNPACAACHNRIDPYGLALEQFDAVGRLRADKRDTSSVLANGTTIDGVEDLKRFLVEEKNDAFVRHLASKMLSYAIGRDLIFSDERSIQGIIRNLDTNKFRAKSLIHSIVLSEPFRMRKNPNG